VRRCRSAATSAAVRGSGMFCTVTPAARALAPAACPAAAAAAPAPSCAACAASAARRPAWAASIAAASSLASAGAGAVAWRTVRVRFRPVSSGVRQWLGCRRDAASAR
jgi:hypothetical protein